MQQKPADMTGQTSGNNQPWHSTANYSRENPLPLEPSNPPRRRGRPEKPAPAQVNDQASIVTASTYPRPSQGRASTAHIANNRSEVNSVYLRPSHNCTTAPQAENNKDAVPTVIPDFHSFAPETLFTIFRDNTTELTRDSDYDFSVYTESSLYNRPSGLSPRPHKDIDI